MRRLLPLLASALALALLSACGRPLPQTPPSGGTVNVKLIAFNDLHGYIAPGGTYDVPDPNDPKAKLKIPAGGAAYLATAIHRLQAENPRNALIAAGDLIGASPLNSGLFHDEPTIEVLDRLGLEISAVGNHEFDEGKDELLRKTRGGCRPGGTIGVDTCLIDRSFAGARFHYLAANVVDNATGQLLFPPYSIKYFDTGRGTRVGIAFVGAVTKNTPNVTTEFGARGLTFLDEATAINAQIPKINAAGVHAIVALVHEGLATTVEFNDKSCAGAAGDLIPVLDHLDPAIAVVVSGHTHWGYVCPDGQGTHGRHVFTTQASSFGRMLTGLDLTLDVATDTIAHVEANNELVTSDAAPNPLPSRFPALAADPAIAAFVGRYVSASAPLVNREVSRLTGALNRTGEDTRTGATGETTMADTIADARLETGGTARAAVAAFVNAGGVRANLEPGVVTYGAMYSVEPFGNVIFGVTLTGAQLYQLLEQQFTGKPRPQIMGVSRGFGYSWDAGAAEGAKIVPGSVKIDGVPVEAARAYRVNVDNFMLGGGDGFVALKEGTDSAPGFIDRDALERFLTAHAPLAPPARNRITRLH